MKVHWTHSAEEQLHAIYEYIARTSPNYALRMVDRLTQRSQQIAAYPLSGRQVPEYRIDQIREVIENPYRIVYYIKPDQIDVIAIIHEARNILEED